MTVFTRFFYSVLQTPRRILALTFAASLLVSLCIFWQNTLINDDGILYLQTAQAFSDFSLTQLLATAKVYAWPFYSILIAVFAKLTSLSLLNSALLINAFFQALFCVYFVRLFSQVIRIESPTKLPAYLLVAMCYILSFQYFNQFRELIIRDHGYWASMLAALFYLLDYRDNRQIKSAIFWQGCLLLAFLFRPEAAVFAFIPMALFILQGCRQVKVLYSTTSILSLLALFALGYLTVKLMTHELSIKPYQFNYLSPEFLLSHFQESSTRLLKDFFPSYVTEHGFVKPSDAKVFLLGGLSSMLLAKVLLGLTLVGLPIYLLGKARAWPVHWQHKNSLFLFAIIAFLAPFTVLFSWHFVTTRYLYLFVVLIGLVICGYWAHFLLCPEATRLPKKVYRFLYYLVIVTLLGSFIDTVHSSSHDRRYFFQAVQEIKALSKSGQKVVCGDKKLPFYSSGDCHYQISKPYRSEGVTELAKQYDYWVISFSRDWAVSAKPYFKDSRLVVDHYQESRRGDRVYFFKFTDSP